LKTSRKGTDAWKKPRLIGPVWGGITVKKINNLSKLASRNPFQEKGSVGFVDVRSPSEGPFATRRRLRIRTCLRPRCLIKKGFVLKSPTLYESSFILLVELGARILHYFYRIPSCCLLLHGHCPIFLLALCRQIARYWLIHKNLSQKNF
jgi:hypothetical protein